MDRSIPTKLNWLPAAAQARNAIAEECETDGEGDVGPFQGSAGQTPDTEPHDHQPEDDRESTGVDRPGQALEAVGLKRQIEGGIGTSLGAKAEREDHEQSECDQDPAHDRRAPLFRRGPIPVLDLFGSLDADGRHQPQPLVSCVGSTSVGFRRKIALTSLGAAMKMMISACITMTRSTDTPAAACIVLPPAISAPKRRPDQSTP